MFITPSIITILLVESLAMAAKATIWLVFYFLLHAGSLFCLHLVLRADKFQFVAENCFFSLFFFDGTVRCQSLTSRSLCLAENCFFNHKLFIQIAFAYAFYTHCRCSQWLTECISTTIKFWSNHFIHKFSGDFSHLSTLDFFNFIINKYRISPQRRFFLIIFTLSPDLLSRALLSELSGYIA